jgi:hypothetical protein
MRNANARSRFRAVNVSARRGRNHFPLRELHSRRNTHRLARRLLDLAILIGPLVLRRQIPSAGRMPSAGKPAPRCWELRNQDVTHYVATAARPGTHRSAPANVAHVSRSEGRLASELISPIKNCVARLPPITSALSAPNTADRHSNRRKISWFRTYC